MFADLYVVTAVSNPERYRSKYALYKDFEKRCIDAGAKLYTVEAAFGDRPHVITNTDTANHIQLRTSSEIWNKENLINIGISRLPNDWKYVAWIDCDITFARPDWVAETIHQLQHFDIVQMYSHVTDLAPDHSPAPMYYNRQPASWMYCHIHDKNNPLVHNLNGYGAISLKYYWHPGFAWAARRSAIDALGGLIDYAIVGGADQIMASALTTTNRFPNWATSKDSSHKWLNEWKARADRYIRGNIGYVPGLILHGWHGRKEHRKYYERRNILRRNNFDPELDLKRDWQGLWQLTDRNSKLRDDIRGYLRARNEDGIDI